MRRYAILVTLRFWMPHACAARGCTSLRVNLYECESLDLVYLVAPGLSFVCTWQVDVAVVEGGKASVL